MCDRYRVIFANVGKTIFDALLMTFKIFEVGGCKVSCHSRQTSGHVWKSSKFSRRVQNCGILGSQMRKLCCIVDYLDYLPDTYLMR